MEVFNLVKNHYRPIQPTVKTGAVNVMYHEQSPPEEIQHFVYCFWQLKTKETLNEAFVYNVVSDGCIDVFFNLNKPSESFVMGFSKKYAQFDIGMQFNYIGIRFFPAAFPLLFHVDAKTLSNESQDLANILPQLAKSIANEIHETPDIAAVFEKLSQLVAFEIKTRRIRYDARFFKALLQIFEKAGQLETETDLHTGLSPRQLRRIFNYYIGTTPKSFSKVVRFQHILNANPSKQSLKEDKLFYAAGFFDQAHFIKDFKNYYGLTPAQAFH